MNSELKAFAKKQFPNSKSDLFAMFMERAFDLLQPNGYNAQVNMQSWMFLSSYEKFRAQLLNNYTFITMAHLGARAFGKISGEVVQTTTFVLSKNHITHYQPAFFRLIEGNEDVKRQALLNREHLHNQIQQNDFKKIPGSPIAYWAKEQIFQTFLSRNNLSSIIETREGLATGSNDLFMRNWNEINITNIAFDSKPGSNKIKITERWFPYIKGGQFRRWYGNLDYVVNWYKDGIELKNFKDEKTGRIRSHNYNGEYAFKEGGTWSGISSGIFAVRYVSEGFKFDAKGPMAFEKQNGCLKKIVGLLNSSITNHLIKMLAPTLDFKLGHILNLPYDSNLPNDINFLVSSCIAISKNDWNSYETSWEFQNHPLINHEERSLPKTYQNWQQYNQQTIAKMQHLEQENNRLFIDAYGLQDELTSDVPPEQITLTINPKYRYGTKLSDEALETRFSEDTIKELISYVVGNMMGRYRLDNPGLIYAHSENIDFDKIYNALASEPNSQDKYPENPFIADEDGIIPLTDREWFPDDATNRLIEFVKVAWPEESLNENLHFIADNLKPKASESSVDTIRRYFSSSFFKDHLKTYKKRPIYWLFSSGKHKAFEALVYLLRYNEGTLARMRMEYVIPLQSRISNQIDKLEGDIAAASSTALAKKSQKERDLLSKQYTELLAFDEQLRHYADQRIKLDLDDGVKVNYGKFGNLLAEVKAVTGKK